MKREMRELRVVATVILLSLSLLLLAGCDDSEDSASSIPDDVIEVADGVFNGLVGEAMEYGPTGSYPTGMTVSDSGNTRTIDLSDCKPEGTFCLNGSIQITTVDSNTMKVVGSIAISGHTYSSVQINASAYWSDPSQDEPDSVTGTFTVDGTSYAMEDIMQRLQELE